MSENSESSRYQKDYRRRYRLFQSIVIKTFAFFLRVQKYIPPFERENFLKSLSEKEGELIRQLNDKIEEAK